MGQRSLVTSIADAYGTELDAGQQSALLSWLAFTGTFSTVRGITHAIKDGKGPFGNLSVGGEHLHHYMWGIGMLAGVGAVAVRGTEGLRRHPVTAVAYGAGPDVTRTALKILADSLNLEVFHALIMDYPATILNDPEVILSRSRPIYP